MSLKFDVTTIRGTQMIARLKRMLTEELFATTQGGQRVFFRFGGFVGDVISDRGTENRLLNFILIWDLISSVLLVALIAITQVLSLELGLFAALAIVLILLRTLVFLFVRRSLTQSCIRLPHDLSFRIYALSKHPDVLWKRFYSACFLFVFTLVWVFMPSPSIWSSLAIGLALIWFIAIGTINGYALLVQRRESSCEREK